MSVKSKVRLHPSRIPQSVQCRERRRGADPRGGELAFLCGIWRICWDMLGYVGSSCAGLASGKLRGSRWLEEIVTCSVHNEDHLLEERLDHLCGLRIPLASYGLHRHRRHKAQVAELEHFLSEDRPHHVVNLRHRL